MTSISKSIEVDLHEDSMQKGRNCTIGKGNDQKDRMEEEEIGTVRSSNDIFTKYESFIRWNVRFVIIGNTYAFKFNLQGEPKYVIGKSYWLALLTLAFMTALSIVFIMLLRLFKPMLILPFLLLLFLSLYLFIMTYITNPGLILKSSSLGQVDQDQSDTCSECDIITSKDIKSHHCKICKICIKGFDHHCGVIGKCVGKGNFIWFILMVISSIATYFIIFYGTISLLIYYYYYSKPK